MPVNDRYPLEDVLAECRRYVELRAPQGVHRVRDARRASTTPPSTREQLAELLDRDLFKVNLIPYNPTGMYDGSSRETIGAFKHVLDTARLPSTVRLTRGRDIAAACGQLAATA